MCYVQKRKMKVINLKRNALQQLIEWKNSEDRETRIAFWINPVVRRRDKRNR